MTARRLRAGRVVLGWAGLWCGFAASLVQGADAPPAPVPWELRPYRAQISVAFADDPQLTPAFRQAVLAGVAETTDRFLGEMWRLETEENRWLYPVTAAGLERLESDAVRELPTARGRDKLFVLVVEPHGAVLRLAGREWDASTQQLGPARTRAVAQRRELAGALHALAYELFRPIAAIEVEDQTTVQARVQAGGFPPSDPDQSQLRPGLLWRPFYRALNKAGEVERTQSVPWTYLRTVDEGTESLATAIECRIVTGLRSPLPPRKRPRIEALAIALHPSDRPTRLQLHSNRGTERPLVGYDVDVVTDADAPPRRLLTDRAGAVTIAPEPGHPQVWLVIRSGQALLARLPFIPGVEAVESVDLPDDSIRLAVDGKLAVLQANLMDTVVRRALAIVQLKKLAQTGNWTEVKTVRDSLKELPSVEKFRTELNAIRIPAVKAAREQKDAVMAARIEKLCDETRDLVLRFLDDDKLRGLDEELAELKKLAADDAALLQQQPEQDAEPLEKPAPAAPPAAPPKPDGTSF